MALEGIGSFWEIVRGDVWGCNMGIEMGWDGMGL
jgi:hypothetical protein